MLLGLILFSQIKNQAKIRVKFRIKIFSRLHALNAIKKAIIPLIILSLKQKTSYSLNNFYVNNYKFRDLYKVFVMCIIYLLSSLI